MLNPLLMAFLAAPLPAFQEEQAEGIDWLGSLEEAREIAEATCSPIVAYFTFET